MKCFYSFLFLLGSLLASGQTTDVKYLSGQGSDDAVEWDFFCTGGRKSGEWNKIKVSLLLGNGRIRNLQLRT